MLKCHGKKYWMFKILSRGMQRKPVFFGFRYIEPEKYCYFLIFLNLSIGMVLGVRKKLGLLFFGGLHYSLWGPL